MEICSLPNKTETETDTKTPKKEYVANSEAGFIVEVYKMLVEEGVKELPEFYVEKEEDFECFVRDIIYTLNKNDLAKSYPYEFNAIAGVIFPKIIKRNTMMQLLFEKLNSDREYGEYVYGKNYQTVMTDLLQRITRTKETLFKNMCKFFQHESQNLEIKYQKEQVEEFVKILQKNKVERRKMMKEYEKKFQQTEDKKLKM